MAEAQAQKGTVEGSCIDKCGEACRVTNQDGSSAGAKKKGAFCKCGEGWSCVITKTDGPDAGKIFFKCGEGCTCEAGTDKEAAAGTCTLVEGVGGAEAYCECGEGWSCVISKTETSQVGKAFANCGDGCCIKVA